MTRSELIERIGRERLTDYLSEGNNREDLIKLLIDRLSLKDLKEINQHMNEIGI